MKAIKKTKACKKVLMLMDNREDMTYTKALKYVLAKDKRLSRKKLEEELNLYV